MTKGETKEGRQRAEKRGIEEGRVGGEEGEGGGEVEGGREGEGGQEIREEER